MTERTDLTTFWELSPRIIEMSSVTAAPRELTLQDLHDTLKSMTAQASEADDSLDNMDDEPLIDSAGKEDLGGGQKVGITSTLQNAQVAFAAKTTPASTGTATSADANGTSLTDTGATFVTDGVNRGAIIVNFTDQSVAEVLTVNSETQITHRTLVEGSTNQWSISDAYKIWNIEQVNISGGNLVAIDDVAAELDPVFPTAFTQIVRTASASATLQELAAIQFSSFDGGVWYDSTSSNSGTTYPKGTPLEPLNNISDVVAVANERGFTQIFVLGDLTLDTGDVIDGFTVMGQGPTLSTFTINAAASVTNAVFTNATISGTLDGGNRIFQSTIGNLNFVDGEVEQCLLTGTITLSGLAPAHILDCWSGVPGGSTPTIDLSASGSELGLRNYDGGIRLINRTGTDPVSVDLSRGQVIIDASVTSTANMFLRGIGKLTNNSGLAIAGNELLDPVFIQIAHKISRNRSETDPATGIMTVYDDDNVTPLLTANIYEDIAGAVPYGPNSTEINRRNRLE